MNMKITVEKNNGLFYLQIEGEMTVTHAAEIKENLLSNLAACSELEIDLSRVSEMDTSGLQLLLLIYSESWYLNKTVRLTSYSPAVSAVFDLIRMDKEKL